jgi:hypothetical protein
MAVKINELEKAVSLLLYKLKESKGNEIELKNDYYWEIDDQDLYNAYQKPTNITLGQLSDDLNELERLNKSNDPIVYDLKRISSILRALSIENSIAF